MAASQRALIVIDPQNDYLPAGKFPLWNIDAAIANIEQAIAKAYAARVPVVHVQHFADSKQGIAPFFNAGTHGAEIHTLIRDAALDRVECCINASSSDS
jgi:nicotinamidase-related amidase